MKNFSKPLIVSLCVVLGVGISVTLVKGQVPGKKRTSPDEKTTSSVITPALSVSDAPPMRTPEPGSPDAERMAEFQARVKAGLVPTVHIGMPGGLRPTKKRSIPDFVLTQIVPQKGASGEMLAFQQKLSPAFATNDPIPPSRTNHFAWLKAHPNVRIYGWYGTVTYSEVQPDLSVVVAVEFHPKTDITGMRAGLVND